LLVAVPSESGFRPGRQGPGGSCCLPWPPRASPARPTATEPGPGPARRQVAAEAGSWAPAPPRAPRRSRQVRALPRSPLPSWRADKASAVACAQPIAVN